MSTATSTRTRTRTRVGMLAAAILLAMSALTAGAFGVSWAVAANDSSIDLAQTRDEVLSQGRQAVINFNTLDYKHVQRGLDRWERSSTGALHEQVVQGRKANAARIEKAKTTTEAEILASALTELNTRAGKARMIAVVRVTITPEGKQPTVKRSRYKAELTRVNSGTWKLSSLGPVQVGGKK